MLLHSPNSGGAGYMFRCYIKSWKKKKRRVCMIKSLPCVLYCMIVVDFHIAFITVVGFYATNQ